MSEAVETLILLNRRVERLNEEYLTDAPSIVKELELKLIIDECEKLLNRLQKSKNK